MQTAVSGRRAALLGMFIAFSFALPAQQQRRKRQAPVKVQIAKTQDAWRKSLVQLPHPAPGCYKACYPRLEWKPSTCGEPPKYPIMPARNPSHPAGTINAVEGTFPSVSAGIT